MKKKAKSEPRPKQRSDAGRRPMRKIGRWFLVLNVLFALLLIAAWLCTYVDPSKFWPAAFVAISYPVLIIVNLGFTLIWLTRMRWQFVISLIPIALSFGLLGAYFQVGSAGSSSSKAGFNLISYNVHGFNKNEFYNKGDYSAGNQIFNWIYSQDADILCMQEFYSNPGRKLAMVDTFLMMDRYDYVEKTSYREDWKTMSLITFSRFPILAKGKLSDSYQKTYAQWVDADVQGKTLRIVNTHLRSIHLSKEIDLLDKLDGDFYNDNEFKKGTRSLLGKMKAAFIQRAQQTKDLRDFILSSPYPVILCGDLNDTPASYTYRILSGIMEDAFKGAGLGSGRTYNGRLPSFRIDYMLHSPGIKAQRFDIGSLRASDHFPLSVNMEFPE